MGTCRSRNTQPAMELMASRRLEVLSKNESVKVENQGVESIANQQMGNQRKDQSATLSKQKPRLRHIAAKGNDYHDWFPDACSKSPERLLFVCKGSRLFNKMSSRSHRLLWNIAK